MGFGLAIGLIGLLLSFPESTLADIDIESEGFQFSTDGGLGIVWFFNLMVFLIMMIIYYNFRADGKIMVRGSQETQSLLEGARETERETLWVGSERTSPSPDRRTQSKDGEFFEEDLRGSGISQKKSYERDEVTFPEGWMEHGNPISRFLAFYGSWWSAVVTVSDNDVIHTAGLVHL
jgi:hypothetical protein